MHRGKERRLSGRALAGAVVAALAMLLAACSPAPEVDLPDFPLTGVAAQFDAVAEVRVEQEGPVRWNSRSGEKWRAEGDADVTSPMQLSTPQVVVEEVLWASPDASAPVSEGDQLEVWFVGDTASGDGTELVSGERYIVMLYRAPVALREGITDNDVWWSYAPTGVWDATAHGYAPRSGAQRTALYVLAEAGLGEVRLDGDVPSISPAALATLLADLEREDSPAATLLRTADLEKDHRPSSRIQDAASDQADARG